MVSNMIRKIMVVLFLMSILSLVYAENEISVDRNIGKDEYKPGSIISVELKYESHRADIVGIIISETLPEKWKIVSSTPEIGKREQNTFKWVLYSKDSIENGKIEYTVKVPEDESEGEYLIEGEWSAISTGNENYSDMYESTSIKVKIPDNVNVGIEINAELIIFIIGAVMLIIIIVFVVVKRNK